MHAKQGWKEITADGEKREIRAFRQGHTWKIQSRLKGIKEWSTHEKPSLHDLNSLLVLLKKKYMRKRTSLKFVQDVEKLIEVHMR